MSTPAPRYLVCHLPEFRLERCGWRGSEPVALLAEQRGTLRVQACSPAAARAGVEAGQGLAEARALKPDLRVEMLDPEGEKRDLAELAQQLRRVAAAVCPLPPDAVAADLGAPPRVLRSEAELLAQARARLRELGHRARLVVADDLFAARVLAAWGGRDAVVPLGGLAAALAPLPLRALDPPERLAALLRDLGLRRAGELCALDPADVAGRLGPEGLRLQRLARGGGGGLPLAAREPPGDVARVLELPCPVESVEPLQFALNRLCAELCAELEQAGQALVGLELTLEIEDAPPARLALRTGRPQRAAAPLARLLRQRLEGLQLCGPVLALRLEARPVVPFAGAQAPLLVGGDALEPLAQVAARLADALGPDSLSFPAPRDRWRPEAAWAAEPAFDPQGRFREPAPTLALAAASAASAPRDADPAAPHEAWRAALPLPRPALLLREPRPVRLDPPLGTPRRIELEGRWLAVRRVHGPERLCGEWWAAGLDRRYLALELDDGRGLWVYSELGHAFLHGFFDQGPPALAEGAP